MYRKPMQVNSLYSYPYLNWQKPLVLIIAYTLSSTKALLEIRAEEFLPGNKGKGGVREGAGK
jgi:hypothetical protein